jgi:Holliday junction resolvasome RuvABC endonuclease subunit
MKRIKKPKPAPPSLAHLKGCDVIAFDLSLTSTGWAKSTPMGIDHGIIDTARRGMDRISFLERSISGGACEYSLVAFEGLSFGSNRPGMVERTGLAYCVRLALWRAGVPFVLVPPMTLKKFVTGNGHAEKSQMLKAVFKNKIWQHDCQTDDEADACGCLHFALQLIGSEEPQTLAQRECLAKAEVVEGAK